MRSTFVALLLAGSCASAGHALQLPSNSSPRAQRATPADRLEQWLSAVARHQPGTLDAAAIEIASWPDDHLTTVVDDVGELARFLVRAHVRFKRSGQLSAPAHHRGRTFSLTELQRLFGLTDDEAASGDVGRLALRAALLHTDISVNLDEYDRIVPTRTPAPARTALLIADGRQEGVADRGPHWELARSLLDLVPLESRQSSQRRDWYVGAAAFMHSRGRLADLTLHTAKAIRLFPADADVLVRAGAMHETLASPSIQQAVRDLPGVTGIAVGVSDAYVHQGHARTFFQHALEHEPEHAEARVRLGHVLIALGDDRQAAVELRRVLAGAENRLFHYYAALFLGGVQTRLGRTAEARGAYERAASLYPRAQSPRLGLSSLARAAGDRRAAVSALVDWLPARLEDDYRDPWWAYYATELDRADQLLEAWRGSVGKWDRR